MLAGCVNRKSHVLTTDRFMYLGEPPAAGSTVVAGRGAHMQPSAPPPAEALSRGDVAGESVLMMAVVEPRKVVYSAGLQIATSEPEMCVDKVKALAETRGGYMQRMSRDSIVIRVPAEVFDDTLAELEQLGVVISKNVNAQDVTEQFVDLELRLKNNQALLAKLEELLAKADEIKHALAVEKEIARVRTQIERLQGQLNRMNNQIAYATLTVSFVQAGDVPDHVKTKLPFYWLGQLGLDLLMRY